MGLIALEKGCRETRGTQSCAYEKGNHREKGVPLSDKKEKPSVRKVRVSEKTVRPPS